MSKRVEMVAMFLVAVMLVNACPLMTVKAAAAAKYSVLVTCNDQVPLRAEPHNKGAVLKRVPKDTTLYAEKSLKNSKGNTWYVLNYYGSTAYVYKENVVKTSQKVTTVPEKVQASPTRANTEEKSNSITRTAENSRVETLTETPKRVVSASNPRLVLVEKAINTVNEVKNAQGNKAVEHIALLPAIGIKSMDSTIGSSAKSATEATAKTNETDKLKDIITTLFDLANKSKSVANDVVTDGVLDVLGR